MEIKLEKIRKRFDDSEALRSVSLRAPDGKMTALLGPSGCGKTTLLRIISGLLRPDSGNIFFDGKDVTEVPPEKRNVGMVFQNYALFPHMTVAQNIGFGMLMRKRQKKEIEMRVKEVMELVGLKGYEKRKPSELSGGEQQRVALARAIAPEPDILLLDEPLSALDAKLRISLRSEIKRIQKELGITAIYVTHDREEAMAVSDRIAVMNRGRIEQIGNPMEVYRDPKNDFVASFLGDANLIPSVGVGGLAKSPFGDVPASFDGNGCIFFRPGNCRISDKGTESVIISSEPVGDVLRITVGLGNEKIVLLEKMSLFESAAIKPGKKVRIYVDRKYMRFIRCTGRATKTF